MDALWDMLVGMLTFRDMDTFGIITQIIGYVGLVFSIIAFQCKRHNHVMIFKTTNELIFALQYFMLGAYTGVAMNIVGSTRNLLFAWLVKKNRSTLPAQIVFSVFFIVFGIFTWQGPITIVMIAAKIVTTIAYGIKNTRVIRFLTLPTSVCWFIYNFSSNSAAGVLCELFTTLSILTAIVRLDIVVPLIERRKKKAEIAKK